MSDIVYSAGDILLYARQKGDLFDEAIADWTQSWAVHAAVALNNVQKIEALGSGVMINPLNPLAVGSSWSWQRNAVNPDPVRLHNALNWLIGQKGNSYSWADNVNAVIARMGGNVLLDSGIAVNCSGLAEEFLYQAGGVPALTGVVDFHSTTPAGLCRILKITGPGQHL